MEITITLRGLLIVIGIIGTTIMVIWVNEAAESYGVPAKLGCILPIISWLLMLIALLTSWVIFS